MSNHTTKAQRDQWIARAAELMQMNAETVVTNRDDVVRQLRVEYGMSEDSASLALFHAGARKRYELSSEAARLLGRMTSERKAAASRANGAKGGRPRKEQGK